MTSDIPSGILWSNDTEWYTKGERIMNYEMAIVDELGCIVAWCVGYTDEEIVEMLSNHPEWKKTCVCVG